MKKKTKHEKQVDEAFYTGIAVGCIILCFIAVPICLAGQGQIIEKYQNIIYTYINETSEPDAIDWDQLAYEEQGEILRRIFLPENENATVIITKTNTCYVVNYTEYKEDRDVLLNATTRLDNNFWFCKWI